MKIAIDGTSSTGKSTMARQLAKRLNFIYIDTGAMYRAVTLFAIRRGLIDASRQVDEESLAALLPEIRVTFSHDSEGAPHTMLNGEDVEREIRSLEVSSAVSPVAALPSVRAALTTQQREMGRSTDVVMDGRDIGTAVFPDAELKFFIEASPDVRAMRRFKELQQKGMETDYDEVYRNILERDRIDSTRAVAPLRKADDAIVVNNDRLSREEQLELLLDHVERYRKGRQ